MSDFVFQGFEGSDIPREVSRRKSGGTKLGALKIFSAIFAILLVCELCVYLFVVPCLENVEISISGLFSYTSDDIMACIGKEASMNFIRFDSEEVKSNIATIPGIEDVQVLRQFPNKISVRVTERTPVAMTFVTDGGQTVPVQIDKNGVLFLSRTNSTVSDSSIPLISGIPVENIPEGMRIPQKYRALMEQIASIKALSQNYFAAISEIHVMPKEYGNYELVLYPIHSKTRILTGRQLSEEALQYMMVALDVVNTIEPDVEEIDLRYGSVSYRTRASSRQVETGDFSE